jgi:hypothetical protein
MLKDDRKKAYAAAKSAVKAYAKDPSDRNAAGVQAAWEVVKNLQASPIWRQRFEILSRSHADPDDNLN